MAPQTCAPAIAAAERQARLPAKLLGTIALVESGRPDRLTGRTTPWPWTITAGGIGHFYDSRPEAVAAAVAFQVLGVRSIDVGCLQINLLHHPGAFASLDAAFDPTANAAYGAGFLGALYRQFGSWPQAAAAYHSQTPELGQACESRVMAIWPLASLYPDPGFGRRPASLPAERLPGLTPDFAARVRRMLEDRARLKVRFGGLVAPVASRSARRSGGPDLRHEMADLAGQPLHLP